jgi:hypothetical protein
MKKDKINRNNWIWFSVFMICIIIIVIQTNKIDNIKQENTQLKMDVSIFNYKDIANNPLNQSGINYKNEDVRIYSSVWEIRDNYGSQYVGNNVLLDKTILFDFDFDNKRCSVQVYSNFIEGKGNPEVDYEIIGNLTKTIKFSEGRIR